MGTPLHVIKQIIQGDLIGDPSLIIKGVASFEQAEKKDITFADTHDFLKRIHLSKAGAIIVPETHDGISGTLLKVKQPRLAFAKLIEFFNPTVKVCPEINALSFVDCTANVSSSAHIGAFAHIGKGVHIGANSTIHPGVIILDDVVIGNNVIIYPNVTLMKKCQIANNVIIHSGTVIGSDGFGFTPEGEHHYKIPHIGIVQIDSNVEIGACNTIDRATMGKTWIKSGVKTDNMVHIGHNVIIGNNSLIVSNVAIAGSTIIGSNVILAGKAAVGGHLCIGNNVKIGPKSGVMKDVPEGKTVSGSPAMPHKQWLRVQRILSTLPNLVKTIREIRRKIRTLENDQRKLK